MVASVLLAGMLATPGPAAADVFGRIELVSNEPLQQADYAHDPAISGNGRFVAFDGSIGGQTGVFRRDRATGAVEQVAGGDAELPSISADGRYISFTTTAALDPVNDTNIGPDVYVRDMEPQPGEPIYTLASAVNGSAQGLTYQYGANPSFEQPHYGSIASGRSALSADGHKVAFVTTAISNLAGPSTSALQVAVRDLQSHETQLVSVRQPIGGQLEPVSLQEGSETWGAVFTGQSAKAPIFTAPAAYGLPTPVGASISADGSTVAWIGDDVAEQVQTLPGEQLRPEYSEPLWRRIGDGPNAPTRQITAGPDPTSPACVASGEVALSGQPSDPCQGPFETQGEATGIWKQATADPVPRLSADGYTVAFLANAVPINGNFGSDRASRASDLYVADMRDGLTRREALRPLTELASGNEGDIATTGAILDLALSPDGRQVAFTTKRTVFPLGSPAYVSATDAIPGMVELFDADLADDTLTRVTRGFEGAPSEHPHEETPGQDPYQAFADGALSPSFSSSGETLAFSSTASNLVYGDGNTPNQSAGTFFDGSDAFVVSRVVLGAIPTPQTISSAPANPSLTPGWRLGVNAVSRRDGSVLIEVETPGAGTLRAGALGAVLVRAARSSRPGHAGRRSARGGRTGLTVANRTVASREAHPRGAGSVALILKLAKRYSPLAGKPGGLSATVTLTFAAAQHPTLHQSIAVTFRRTATASRRHGRGRVSARRHSRGGKPR